MPPAALADRHPQVSREQLLAGLVPPPRFAAASFDSYLPDPAEPSQQAALQACREFAPPRAPARAGRWRRRGPADPRRPGLYLDGGFGVGKTHLLAALWHATAAPKAYATFVELTGLVGVLGFAGAAEALAGLQLLAIDEFELDDPGDTVLISTLLTGLVGRGVRLAATSNTQPEDLGAGRFAAADFLREIQALAGQFTVLPVDGPDYRHRGLAAGPAPMPEHQVRRLAAGTPGATLDTFDGLSRHLAGLHPSRYGALVSGVPVVCLTGLEPVSDQAVALRWVVLADRLYDRSVPVAAAGLPVDQLFPAELMAGPYRKKYSRAVSRLGALARDGLALTGADPAGADPAGAEPSRTPAGRSGGPVGRPSP